MAQRRSPHSHSGYCPARFKFLETYLVTSRFTGSNHVPRIAKRCHPQQH
jgi:hypothetical protein